MAGKKLLSDAPCPCGSGLSYGECCREYIENGKAVTDGPLTVLRTRYTAYKTEQYEYVLRSWHPDFRPRITVKSLAREQKGIVFTGLEPGLPAVNGNEGYLEYTARFRAGNAFGRLHEKARFLCHDGVWYYVDGVTD